MEYLDIYDENQNYIGKEERGINVNCEEANLVNKGETAVGKYGDILNKVIELTK